jgi:3-hydroxy-9,10-secoandrosta-1,3,5(10)-triene-9,17-dione monooxygenase reductase component
VPDLDPDTLRTVLRRFATGVAVVTTWDGERPWGTTVNSFSSVSLRPPLVMVAFDRERRIVPALLRTGRYAVNILGEGSRALADCFAGGPNPRSESGPNPRLVPGRDPDRGSAPDERDRLCGADWHSGPTGLPVLADAIARLECTVIDVHAAGDHDLYVARVDSAADATGSLPGTEAAIPGATTTASAVAPAESEPMPLLYYSGLYLRIERAVAHELEGKAEG